MLQALPPMQPVRAEDSKDASQSIQQEVGRATGLLPLSSTLLTGSEVFSVRYQLLGTMGSAGLWNVVLSVEGKTSRPVGVFDTL